MSWYKHLEVILMLAYDELERLLVFANLVVETVPDACLGPTLIDLAGARTLREKQQCFRSCVQSLKAAGLTRADIVELLELADRFC